MTGEGDALRYARPGEAIYQQSPQYYNRLVDLSREERSRRYNQGPGAIFDPADHCEVTVRNQSGRDVARFGVLGLTSPLVKPADNLDEYKAVVNFDGVTPTDPRFPFCILLEDLPAGVIGRGLVAGVTPCRVTGAGDFAAPVAGSVAALQCGEGGGARVLWAEAGSSERWAYILMPAGGAAEESFLAQLTAKCYYDGSDARDADGFTPTGTGLNCAPDLDCLGRYIQYSWLRVTDVDTGTCPLGWGAGRRLPVGGIAAVPAGDARRQRGLAGLSRAQPRHAQAGAGRQLLRCG
jgi:hypothetical protein